MRRWIMGVFVAAALLFGGSQRAQAQLATFDFGNLTQAILSFLQDGDNMAMNTSQFLQNLGGDGRAAEVSSGDERAIQGGAFRSV